MIFQDLVNKEILKLSCACLQNTYVSGNQEEIENEEYFFLLQITTLTTLPN
jgi:hypothetical protein